MRKKHWFLVVTGIIILGAGSSFYYWWHTQASTSDVTYGPPDTTDVLGSETRLVDWHTTYFSSKIPSILRQTSSSESSNKPILASYVLSSTSKTNTDQLAVTVGNLNDYSLSELSAVKLRLNLPSEYARTTRSFAPAGALVFNNPTSYETAVFWQHGAQYVAVVVSGTPADRADLEQDLSDVVSSWQWN